MGTRPSDLVVTHGVLASIRRDEGNGTLKWLQTDADAASGVSGGPLVSLDERAVIGVMTFLVDPASMEAKGDVAKFAIPASAVVECFGTYIGDDR